MKIVVLSGGGRGDTQPYAALACGFQRAGHEVVFVTVPHFAPLLDGRDVELYLSDIDLEQIFASETAQDLFGSGGSPLGFMRHFKDLFLPILEQAAGDLIKVCQDADGLVVSTMHILVGTEGVERLGVPYVAAFPAPATPSWYYPSVMSPPLPVWLPGQRLYNRLTHWFVLRLADRFLGRPYRRIMGQELPNPTSLAPLPASILYGFSPRVFSRPPDWGPHIHITGYWFLDHLLGWEPSKDLQDFLAAGEIPVYVGFGSMNTRDPESATRLVCQALERAGRRGVLITGMGGLHKGDLPAHVYAAESLPHDWLFERVSAVVHHCGAGTTAAGLRAGRPTVCVPHMGDQVFWARRVCALGAGPAYIPRKRLTVENLAHAIDQATTDPSIRERARAIGESIRSEDGVGAAVDLALRHFESAKKK
jgi:UDP:flavonoid glycosyltransferase YjiC (YdhE family)